MTNRYVKVNVSRQTRPVSERGFGIPLVLATSKALPYKVYKDLEEVVADFAETTEEYKVFERMFMQEPRPSEIAVYGVSYDSALGDPSELTASLHALVLANNDFYYLVSPEQGDEEITALAEWVSTQDKIYVATTASDTLYDTLSGLYDNVYLMVHDQPQTYPAEGLVAKLATQTIGSYTWTFKNIKGVPTVGFDSTKVNDIHAAFANTYVSEGGQEITSNGQATSGEYIDIIQGQHFIKAEMTKNVFGLLVKMPKVPYNNDGISLVVAEMKKALNTAGANGILSGEGGEYEYTITIPNVNDISSNDKANRVLPDIPWTATIQGAIEKVNINGVLSI